MRSLSTASLVNIAIVVCSIFGAIALGSVLRSRHLENKLQDMTFAKDSIEAVNDSTRQVNGVLADSLLLVTRRATQVQMRADGTDRTLRSISRVRAGLTATVTNLDTVATAPVVDSIGTRQATLTFRQEPYTGILDVEMTATQARAQIGIKLDPAHIGMRVTCSAKRVDGIRQASIYVSTPPWLRVNVDSVSQDRVVCNDDKRKHSIVKPALIGGALLIGGFFIGSR